MSRTPPPQVASEPHREHLIATYTISLQITDGTMTRAATATGELRWLPDVAWRPPVLILTVVFLVVVATVAIATRPRYERWTPLARTVAGILLLVVSANIIRTIDDLTTLRTGNERVMLVIACLVALAAVSALRTRGWRGHPGGFAALAGAAMLIMLVFGGEASDDLSAPQLVTSFPEWLRRWTIATSYTVVAPAFLAAVLAGRWYSRTRPNVGFATLDPVEPGLATPGRSP